MPEEDACIKFSVCVLLYGDYPELAERCLGTLQRRLSGGINHIQDIRLGLNDLGARTKEVVEAWCRSWDRHRLRILMYTPSCATGKYPLMRRMFYDKSEPLAALVMWFDDDTFFVSYPATWWQDILHKMATCHMLGQSRWVMPVQGRQWDWIKTQPWFNPDVGPPKRYRNGRQVFQFCQGSWWVIRRDVLESLNWPIPELHHNGGDSLLGEAFRHQGLTMEYYDRGLRLNADDAGRNSKAERRGLNTPVIGKHYDGTPLPTEPYHNFEVEKLVYGESRRMPPEMEIVPLPCW